MGDYERALAAHATAFALLDRLDTSDAEVRGELSRLHSNAGLVRSWDAAGALGTDLVRAPAGRGARAGAGEGSGRAQARGVGGRGEGRGRA